MRRVGIVASLLLLAGSMSFVSVAVLAQVKKGKERPLLTRHLMKGLVKEHCGALKSDLDGGPASAEDWDSVALHAALLNEASYVLMADKRCPDGTWYDAATKTLREGSAGVLKAAAAKDVEAAKTAFGAMTKACGACHKAHKPKK